MDAQSELGMKKADMFWMRYPDRRFTASMEFVMDISLKVQLRGGQYLSRLRKLGPGLPPSEVKVALHC